MKRVALLLVLLLFLGCGSAGSAVLYQNGNYAVHPRNENLRGLSRYIVTCNGTYVLETDDYGYAKMMVDKFASDGHHRRHP